MAHTEIMRQPGSTCEPSLRDEMLACIPSLRAFAISFLHNLDESDDLVQDTIVRAWSNLHRFERGTNLQAWLFTILRNQFYSRYRKRRREVEDPDAKHAAALTVAPEQLTRLEHGDLRRALGLLTAEHREALLLVGAEGMSYEQTAAICNVPVGTIKSRVHRARVQLAALMHLEAEDLGADGLKRAVSYSRTGVIEAHRKTADLHAALVDLQKERRFQNRPLRVPNLH
jgi:RNA polymerase sigma-70 factor, ECF subfamily